MDLGLRDAVAVVAASSQGIGKAVALEFAREGARVVINGRNPDTLSRTAEEIAHATGAEPEQVVADLSDPAGPKTFIQGSMARFGRIDALFVNGGGPPSKPFQSASDQDWTQAIELTLLSSVRLIREALPYLKESKGSIVTLTSISVKQPVSGLVLSNSIRPGVIGLGKTLADELAADGIRVNSVAPGMIWTGRQEYLVSIRAEKQGITVEAAVEEGASNIPLRRYGDPAEVAALVVFLSSSRASYITGTTILVDGGLFRGLD